MKHRDLFDIFLFILTLICFYIFERNQMFAFDVQENNLLFLQWIPVFLFLFVIVYILKNGNYKTDRVSRRLTVLMVSLYVVSLLAGGAVNTFRIKSEYITVILPLFLFIFANVACRSQGDLRYFNICVSIIIILLAIYYFDNLYSLGVMALTDLSFQTPGSYTLLYLLPFVLCLPKMSYRIIGMFLIFIAIIVSLKRGGIVAYVASVIIYFLVFLYSYRKKKIKFFTLFVSTAFIVTIFLFYDYFEQATYGLISQRFQDIATDKGSGRVDIYAAVWELIKNSSFSELLLGHGWQSVSIKIGITAHNDFLEVLYDFGLFVFLFYLSFIFELLKKTTKLINERSFYAPPLAASIVLFLVNSMVSHIIIYPKYMMIMCLFWGMISSASIKNNYQLR